MASCPPIYAWADNNQQMDPCEVASSLMDVCDSSLPPLQPVSYYPEDTYPVPATNLQSSCVCSSVIYALVSACSDCQGGKIQSWPTWSANCVSPSVDSFKMPPENITVPAWAYIDVNLHPTYSPSAASSSALQAIPLFTIANAAATAAPTPTSTFQTTPTDTSTLTTTKSSLTLLKTASFGSDLSSATTGTGNRTAAIAGGAIAAVVILVMGVALAYWYMRRRRRTRVPPSAAYMAVHGYDSFVYR